MKYNIVLMSGLNHLENITFCGEYRDIDKFVRSYCLNNRICWSTYDVFANRGDLKQPDHWDKPLTKWFDNLMNDVIQERLKT